ncbi:MAG: response regulator [Candidatus Omnitrophica bacterium]|nr:response regulator [Candidatus Omnitrophota bacterium]
MKKQVLVCDDERGVRESLKLILCDKYDVIFAESGAQAIELINQNQEIKCLLLDIKMPPPNGIELLKYLKDRSISVPVIVITGYQSVETAAESLNNGAVSYITKPFRSESVLDALEKAIS